MAAAPISRVRDLGLALRWGALWGVALGFWLVAPSLIEVHHLVPRTTAEWTVLEAALLALFASGGALLGVVAGTPLVLWRNLRGSDFRDAPAAFALALPPLLVVVYLGWSAGIEWLALRGLSVVAAYRPVFERVGGLFAASAALALLCYRAIARLEGRARRAVPLLIAGGAACAGALRLPVGAEGPPSGPPELPPLVRRDASGTRAPILFVGLDGANWRLLHPSLVRGELPTLARVLADGLHGQVEAPWAPHWSAPAWAAILSGFPREETGIHEDLAAFARGLPPFQVPFAVDLVLNPVFSIELVLAHAGIIQLAHPTREMLRHAPFWEPLTEAGVRTGVVRFRFTFPAAGATAVITDWAGKDQWAATGVHLEAPPEALARPAPDAGELLEPFRREESPAPPLTRFLAEPDRRKPRDATIDPIGMLRIAADIDARTLEAAHRMLRLHPDLDLLAVYLGGIDTVQHAFWQYRFPKDFPGDPPDPADVEALGRVPSRYLAWLDTELARLLAAFSTTPNVMVVSDHGYEAIHDHALFRGWHAAEGAIFLAAGPDVPRSDDPLEVTYLDVAPTVIRLSGFEPPEALPGVPLF